MEWLGQHQRLEYIMEVDSEVVLSKETVVKLVSAGNMKSTELQWVLKNAAQQIELLEDGEGNNILQLLVKTNRLT